MHDLRLALGETLLKHLSQEEVLCRAGAAEFTQHPLDAAITRAPIVEHAHGFDQLKERGVVGRKAVDGGKGKAPMRLSAKF